MNIQIGKYNNNYINKIRIYLGSHNQNIEL